MDGESILVANNGKKKKTKTLSKWHGEVGWEATQITGHLEMSGQHASSSYGWMRKVYRQQTLQIVREEVGAGGTYTWLRMLFSWLTAKESDVDKVKFVRWCSQTSRAARHQVD